MQGELKPVKCCLGHTPRRDLNTVSLTDLTVGFQSLLKIEKMEKISIKVNKAIQCNSLAAECGFY